MYSSASFKPRCVECGLIRTQSRTRTSKSCKPCDRFFGDKIQIRRVGKIVEAIGDDGKFAVNDFERRDVQIFADAERRIMFDRVRNQLRQTAAEMRRLKDILKNAPQIFPRDFVGDKRPSRRSEN